MTEPESDSHGISDGNSWEEISVDIVFSIDMLNVEIEMSQVDGTD